MAETKEVTSAVRSIDPEDFTVSEIQSRVETVSDVSLLEEMVQREKDGKNRKGAKAALASRKEELVNDTEDENDEAEEEEQDFVARDPNVKDDGAGIVKKIQVARLIADEIGCNREILYGVARDNEELDGWTDGDEFIALTESAMDRGNYISWSQQIFHVIVKMWAYADPSLETSRDGSYGHRFAKYLDRHEDDFLDLADDFWLQSLNDTLRETGYHPDQSDE